MCFGRSYFFNLLNCFFSSYSSSLLKSICDKVHFPYRFILPENEQIFLDFAYSCLTKKVPATKKHALQGFKKNLLCWGYLMQILSINEVGGTCKMCILTALKSASQILDHDLMMLSLETFKLGPAICKACYQWFQNLASVW